ncbi:MAG: hypothetical protein HWD83_03070, partial [Gammaproteobacteria bacterium]|nr:hypothetical protein [Gammaproteobacteria bacterium]
MKLVIVSNKHNRSRHITLSVWSKAVLSLCLLGVPAAAGFFVGQTVAEDEQSELLSDDTILTWQTKVAAQQAQIDDLLERERLNRQAIELQLATMHSQLLRIDALGERLTSIAGIDNEEFDFSQPPALGGPLSVSDESYEPSSTYNIETVTANFATLLADREDQLSVLESLLLSESQQRETTLAGRPIKWG